MSQVLSGCSCKEQEEGRKTRDPHDLVHGVKAVSPKHGTQGRAQHPSLWGPFPMHYPNSCIKTSTRARCGSIFLHSKPKARSSRGQGQPGVHVEVKANLHCLTRSCIKIKKLRGWRNDSLVKSTCCPFLGTTYVYLPFLPSSSVCHMCLSWGAQGG